MLDHIAEDGTFSWTCPRCNTKQTAHISHEHTRYSELDPTHVILPKCPCGSQTGVNVVFPDHALAEPVIHRGTHPITGKENSILGVEVLDGSLYQVIGHVEKHAINGEPVVVQIIDDVQLHRAVAPHQELHRQLQAIGKLPPTQEEINARMSANIPTPGPAVLDIKINHVLLDANTPLEDRFVALVEMLKAMGIQAHSLDVPSEEAPPTS